MTNISKFLFIVKFFLTIIYNVFIYQDETKTLDTISNKACKLPDPVQRLIRLLFDVESMKKVMYEFEVSCYSKFIIIVI